MKKLTDRAGIRVFETVYIISIVLLLYSLYQPSFICPLILFPILYYTFTLIEKKTAVYLKTDGKYVLITGCDSGFGNGLARYLDELGMTVFATCLNIDSPGAQELKSIASKRLHILQMDVSQAESITTCLKEVETICGKTGLWGIVNNAGVNFLGDVELCTIDQYTDIANVNLFGMVRVTKQFLPLIRKATGRIINVTSVKGRLSLPANSVYGITKYGGEAFSDCLRQEMKRFGIKVIIIEPGNFGGATGCLNDEGIKRIKSDLDTMWSNATDEVKEVYGKEYQDSLFKAAVDSAVTTYPNMDPVMECFKEALLKDNPDTRYLVPGGKGMFDIYCLLARLNDILPICVMDRLITKYFMAGLPQPQALKEKSKTQ